jgi:cellulose synthase/poly-beta-1,6-N-acetylglucosamine synthase-like glycosyltransferase
MISNIIILVGIILFLLMFILPKSNNSKPLVSNNLNDYAILIPARNEANVLENLLISIEKQSFKIAANQVYVILESRTDSSVDIVNKHHMQVIYRTNPELKRKGYALDEAIKEIIKEHTYDAYFIMDADNILDVNYLKEMHKMINAGYDIGIGYRNTKNGNVNITSVCSTLTFSLINTLNNQMRLKNKQSLIVSGTGFYISGKVINKLKGYPFHSLTEDYELSLYAALNKLSTYYNPQAIFYDEQPTNLKVSIKQRSRWVKGYFSSRHKYLPLIINKLFQAYDSSLLLEVIGIIPYILILAGLAIKIILNIKFLIPSLLIIYLVLFILTLIMLVLENNQINLNTKSKILGLIFNPLFLFTYVYCLFIALFNKDLSWDPIKHSYNKID